MEYKLNKELTLRSDKYNLILERTTLNTAKNAKKKYVTSIEGCFPSLSAVYKYMVNTAILKDPSILSNFKTMIDVMDKLCNDIENNCKVIKQ